MSICVSYGEGFLFLGNFFFGEEEVPGKVFLKQEKGSEMKYGKETSTLVDFPGEYDIQGTFIRCIDAGGLLHFVLQNNEDRIALLQSTAPLEKENIESIDTRYVANEMIKEEILRLELDGDVVLLSELDSDDSDAEQEFIDSDISE